MVAISEQSSISPRAKMINPAQNCVQLKNLFEGIPDHKAGRRLVRTGIKFVILRVILKRMFFVCQRQLWLSKC